jgi:hypothetical protein
LPSVITALIGEAGNHAPEVFERRPGYSPNKKT